MWVLANLSGSIVLDSLETHTQSFDDFTSNSNVSLAQLYSFARPTILELSNFTEIFYNAVENDYTKSMWDNDVTLVIYLSNLSRPMTFKITVDQQDFLFLLYFFITFITYVHLRAACDISTGVNNLCFPYTIKLTSYLTLSHTRPAV